MKEVTYEDWRKNPTPRMMWCWDDKVGDKVKRKVIYFNENKHAHYHIIALSENSDMSVGYKHCAEIEKPKIRRMTNKELARWLREKPTREWKYAVISTVHGSYSYDEECGDVECWCEIVVREDDGEWREPLVETDEYKDYLESEKAYNDGA